MKRRTVILFTLLVAIIVLWIRSPSADKNSTYQTLIKVTFTGREPGLPSRTAGLGLTDGGSKSALLEHMSVSVSENDGSKGISDGGFKFSPTLQLGRTNVNESLVVEPDRPSGT